MTPAGASLTRQVRDMVFKHRNVVREHNIGDGNHVGPAGTATVARVEPGTVLLKLFGLARCVEVALDCTG